MPNSTLISLVFSLFLIIAPPLYAECQLVSQFDQAYQNNQPEKLKKLLNQLDQSSCSSAKKDKIRYLSAKLIYQQLAHQAPKGDALSKAYESFLNTIHGMFWPVLIDQGDLALKRGDYSQALGFYQKALIAIDDIAYTPIGEPQFPELIPLLHKKASISRLASAAITQQYIEAPVNRSGKSAGVAMMSVRGVEIKTIYVPIRFDYADSQLRETDLKYAEQIYQSLKDQAFPAIRLTGHTDYKGESAYNQQLSVQRANSVKHYLQAKGYSSLIEVEGRGESMPPEMIDQHRLADEHWRQICRRVEVTRL